MVVAAMGIALPDLDRSAIDEAPVHVHHHAADVQPFALRGGGLAAHAGQTEDDPAYRTAIDASHTPPPAHSADAIGWAARTVAGLLDVAAVVAYTSSGASALRVARERPRAPILGLTPQVQTARRLSLAWGVQPKVSPDIRSVQEMTELGLHTVAALQPSPRGQTVVIVAGMPFGVPGSTNLLRIARTDARSPRANPGDLEPVVNDGLPADPDLARTTA